MEIGRGRFVGLVAVQAALFAASLFWIDRVRQPLLLALLLFLMSLPWLYLCHGVLTRRFRVPLVAVLTAAVLLRLLGQAAAPALSDDLFRYVWEGRMQLAGHNPFLTAPEDPSIAQPGDPIWESVNNKKIPAAYPPVCQLYLRVLAAVGADGPSSVRTGFALCDLLCLFLLAAWLARIGLDPAFSIVYALCPLALMEWSVEGHNDSLAMLFLLLSLVLLEGGERRLTWKRAASVGLFFGLSVSAKFLPIVFLPFFLRRDLRIGVVAMLVVPLSYLPYWPGMDAAPGLFEGITQYGARWRHNDSAFYLIHEATAWAKDRLAAAGVTNVFATGEVQRLSKLPLALLFAGLLAVVFWRARPGRAESRGGTQDQLALGDSAVPIFIGLFILSPVLHPWYMLWCLPFLALRPSPALFALLSLGALSHHTLARWHSEGVWEELWYWKLLEFAPFYAILLAQAILSRLRASGTKKPPATSSRGKPC